MNARSPKWTGRSRHQRADDRSRQELTFSAANLAVSNQSEVDNAIGDHRRLLPFGDVQAPKQALRRPEPRALSEGRNGRLSADRAIELRGLLGLKIAGTPALRRTRVT